MENEPILKNPRRKTVAIIPAAGSGIRMGTRQAKQFLDLADKPILTVTLERFQGCPCIDAVIPVVPPDDVNYCRNEIIEPYDLTKVTQVVAGGKRRQDSVRLGLEATHGDFDLVVIHDGVRPLVQETLIERTVAAATESRAVITGLPAKETVKEVSAEGWVIRTHDRRRIWLVQTPQVFRYEDIHAAHGRALREDWEEVTDDALLIERSGITVKMIEGSEENIKITTLHDLEWARALLMDS
ncbi:2-C-methyl-D-erythritol 4-phosphate cytidylyltransferase [Thermodesulfobacteriota bacterium]